MLWDASDAYGEFLVCTAFQSRRGHSSYIILILYCAANNRYDKKIKEALAKNGQDVPDGGSGSGPGSGSGVGGNGGTSSSTPSGGGVGTNASDGGVGVLCLHAQEDEEVQAMFETREVKRCVLLLISTSPVVYSESLFSLSVRRLGMELRACTMRYVLSHHIFYAFI